MHHACPHHADALVRNRVECVDSSLVERRHVDCWRCERCDGLWLPGAVVERVVGASPRWPAAAQTRPTPLPCPDGHGALRAVDADGIELDLCPACHGVWLDRGELEDIVARRHGREDNDDAVAELVDELLCEAEDGIDRASRRPRGGSSKDDGDADVPAPGGGTGSMPSGGSVVTVRGPSAPTGSGSAVPSAPPPVAATDQASGMAAFDVERARGGASSFASERGSGVTNIPDASAFETVDAGFDLLGSAGDALEAVFSFLGDAFSSF